MREGEGRTRSPSRALLSRGAVSALAGGRSVRAAAPRLTGADLLRPPGLPRGQRRSRRRGSPAAVRCGGRRPRAGRGGDRPTLARGQKRGSLRSGALMGSLTGTRASSCSAVTGPLGASPSSSHRPVSASRGCRGPVGAAVSAVFVRRLSPRHLRVPRASSLSTLCPRCPCRRVDGACRACLLRRRRPLRREAGSEDPGCIWRKELPCWSGSRTENGGDELAVGWWASGRAAATVAARGGPRLVLCRAPGLCFLLCFYVFKDYVYLAERDSKSRDKQGQWERDQASGRAGSIQDPRTS